MFLRRLSRRTSFGHDIIMFMDHPNSTEDQADPLIDEVRAIRRSICDQFDNDVDRLTEHLRQIEHDYLTRTGDFKDLPRSVESELFPEVAQSAAVPCAAEAPTVPKD
jgi:hypothetical protein